MTRFPRRLWVLFREPEFGSAMRAIGSAPELGLDLRSATDKAKTAKGRAKGSPAEKGSRGADVLALPPAPPPIEGRPKSGRIRSPKAIARRALKFLLGAIAAAHLCFIASTSILTLTYKWMDPPATLLMAYRKFANGFEVKPARPVKTRDIRPRRREMLIRIEDWNFYRHHGFDLAAIKNAYLINARIGRPMYGGSTLSMQTARTLFLLPVKSYFRKYLEAIVTVEIELILGKNRILELYYSYAEWGRGIFGIQAASRAYYGLPVERITDDQYARLIALLSSPVRYAPQTLRNNRLLAWRYDFLVNRYMAPVEAAEEGKPEASLAAPAQASDPAGQADGPEASAIIPPAAP